MKKVTSTSIKAILLFSLCFSVACSSKKKDVELSKAAKPNMLVAEGIVVMPQSFESDYTASGTLLPNEEVQILSEVSGRVTDIAFAEGKQVTKGQVLLKVYNEDVRAQIQKSKAQRELQEKIKARQAELLRIGGISQQDYETTVAQIQTINADIAYSEAMLRKTTIVAPFSGKIGIRNVSAGAVITPATIIATLQQTHVLKLDFTIPDQYRNEVVAGKIVSFTVTGSQDTFKGTVSAIDPSADAVTRTLKVRALVKNDKQQLAPGSFTRVVIPFDNDKNALLIPSQSVIPTARDKKVAVVRGGKAKLVTVIIGTRTSDKVEIVQGLSAGDTILTTGIMQVKDNMSVKVSVKKPAA